MLVVAAFAAALPASAQYQGTIAKPEVNTPDLRAVGVLEWTGDEAHPKASRLIPICIYDGQELEDAGIYMARPAPMALETEVEYQLQQDGKPVGLFIVDSAGEQQGSWVGFGKMKPIPVARPRPTQIAKVDEDDAQSDTPVLHRKHPAGNSGGGDSGSGSGSNGPPPDPDRPSLHKGGDTSSSDSSGDSGGSGSSDSDAPAPDPDRPTLHRSDDSSSSSTSSSSSGQQNQSKSKKKNQDDEGYVEDVATVTDPERPRLFRGKSEGYSAPVVPTLVGLPTDLQQEVAVSDAKNRPVHLWDYSWANPDDQAKMKAAMEQMARTALGLNPPPAPAKPAAKTGSAAHKTSKSAAASTPLPAPLIDEQFHVFELAYGSGATMVLSAHTAGAGAPIKFVTLVAQPDLYGNVTVLLKNVSEAGHLDETPRWRLVDAVDAMADNRGDLLFELRGDTQRQFALYRVLRGQATRIFLSGADAIGGAAAGN